MMLVPMQVEDQPIAGLTARQLLRLVIGRPAIRDIYLPAQPSWLVAD